MRLLILLSTAIFLTSCYEDREGCLDPDAGNYDLLADEQCGDCCTLPNLSVQVTSRWGEDALDLTQTYKDGAGNAFRLLRFRYYLGDIELLTAAGPLPKPENSITVSTLSGRDTTRSVMVNANLLLRSAGNGATTSAVGTLRIGNDNLTGIGGTFGLPEDLVRVLPSSAPSGSPLATQVGLLNLLDGRGYVRAKLEYVLVGKPDTITINTFGRETFELDFGGEEVIPVRGFNLTVVIEADVKEVLGRIDLSADPEAIGPALNSRLIDLLTVTQLRQ